MNNIFGLVVSIAFIAVIMLSGRLFEKAGKTIWLSMEFALPIYGYGPDRTMNQENAENMAPERKNPSELSAGEIVEALYANEPDQTIAEAAKDEVMILTGESTAEELYGYIKIGQYKGTGFMSTVRSGLCLEKQISAPFRQRMAI